MNGRRSFASKLIRDSNVDVRHRLAKLLASASESPLLSNDDSFVVTQNLSTSSEESNVSSPKKTMSISVTTNYCDTPITDLVDPVDYEDFILTNNSRIPHHLKSVLLFPADDIRVEKYQPPPRTLESTSPEFNNVQTSEDPYIQSIGSYTPHTQILVKKYDKCSSLLGLNAQRLAQTKELERQEYEIDIVCIPSENDPLDSLSTTPNTFCSRPTSVKNTPRPQSLISSTSTVRPPLASDEEVSADEEDDKYRTPIANDIPDIDNSIDTRNSWLQPDNNLDKFSTINSRTKGLFSLQNSQSDPEIEGILENNFYRNFFDNSNKFFKSDSNNTKVLPLFALFPLQNDDENFQSRLPVPPPSDVTRYRLQFKCLSLKMELMVEPIFASIAIYDAKERKKITENFYFDVNSDSLKRLLRTHIAYQDMTSLSRSAIFNLSQLSPDMYFVIKLEKVLQTDINDIIDIYVKPSDDSNKIEKLKILAATNCERLGRYRMPFAWTAIPLVDVLSSGQLSDGDNESLVGDNIISDMRNNSSSLDSLKRIANECSTNFARKGSLERHSTLASAISNFSSVSISSNNSANVNNKRASVTADDLVNSFSNFKSVTITNKIFYRHESDRFSDDELYKLLHEFKRSTFKRLRSIRGLLKMDVSPVKDECSIPNRVSPELARVHPYIEDRNSAPTKELLEFRDLLIPHIQHRNLLYIYPRTLNFTNRQGSARNIAIKIEVFSIEEKFNALPVIFGKSSCPEMLTEAFTSVNYHTRNPSFNEEFKIRLPIKLNKQTHILFTFIHVHTKQKSETPIDEVVGYTWLPLCRDDCLQTGTFFLPVMAEMPPAGYSFLSPINQDTLPNAKWVDNHKPLFVVQLDSYSSIFAQDPQIDRFFRITSSMDSQEHMSSCLHSSNMYEEYVRAITGLAHSNTDSLIKFLHLILNRLILLMVRPPRMFSNQMSSHAKSFQTLIFDTMIIVVSKINTCLYDEYAKSHSTILCTFVQFQAVFPEPEVRDLNDYSTFNEFNRSKQVSGAKFNDSFGGESAKNTELGKTELVCRHFHEEVLAQVISSNDTIRDKVFENAQFVFDIIYKSLCVHFSLNNLLHVSQRNRLNKTVMDNLNDVVKIVAKFVLNNLRKSSVQTPTSPTPSYASPHLISNLNRSLAFFLRDLLSVVDRNFVFNLIKTYLRKLGVAIPVSNSFHYQITNESINNLRTHTDELFELRIDFLRIVCSHEHFLALNLPFSTPVFTALDQCLHQSPNQTTFSPSSSFAKVMLNSSIFSHSIFDRIRPYAELTDDFRRQHWLLGLLFCTLVDSFTQPKVQLQIRAANLMRTLLTSYDWDDRYKDSEIKSRIACLFLPLIGIMIDIILYLHDPSGSKDSPFFSDEENRKYAKKSQELSRSFYNNSIDSSIAMAIAGSAVINGNPPVDQSSDVKSPDSNSLPSSPQHCRHNLTYQQIGEEATRILLISFLWVIGNIEQKLFRRYLNEFSNERFLAFLELLRLSARVFEYEGERSLKKSVRFSTRRQSVQKLEDCIKYGTARREMMKRRDFSQSFNAPDGYDTTKRRWRKDATLQRYNSLSHTPMIDMEQEVLLDGYLGTMVNYIIIDTLALILSNMREKIFRSPMNALTSSSSNHSSCNLRNKYASDEFIVGSALQVILQLLSLKQSTNVLEAAFHCQRALLFHFPDLLFIEGLPDVEFCSELCCLLLKHCGSKIAIVRAQSSASMYLLMRQNYHSPGNFSRIKIQVTMSLSHLVGTSNTFDERLIRRALKSILVYTESDKNVDNSQFPGRVSELIFNLHMILSDTIKMKEHERDPEMLLDLMYRVAKGYQNSPELRLTWLQNMAQKHAELSQNIEAAECYAHASALVVECLHKVSTERRTYLPLSCVAFQRLCPNVFEENLNSNSEIDKSSFSIEESPIESTKKTNSVRSAKLFSENGLVTLLENTAKYFNVGGMYEAVNEAYKLLIPIHEAHHRYAELAKIHRQLHDVFINIEQHEGKRVFATYFRVGFYGSLFGDLDGEEFVYKERYLAKLPEISTRLENFYSNRFGSENLEMIKDSNTVDVSKLNPSKAFIQITYLEPFFDLWESEVRHTCYERNHNIKRFIYSTPFTLDGRAHGQLYEQCKRKTILTTAQSFPYVKTRIQVQDRQQLVLSPIEVAIEDVQKKTNQLKDAAHSEPVDVKILQMVLQGCVGTTVNQGPIEIALVFLSNEPNIPVGVQRPPPSHQNKLRLTFKDFCDRCGEALKRNRDSIDGTEQQNQYHKQLERNFFQFTEQLAPLMGQSNVIQSKALLREAYFNVCKPISPTSTSKNNNSSMNGLNNNINGGNNLRIINGLTNSSTNLPRIKSCYQTSIGK